MQTLRILGALAALTATAATQSPITTLFTGGNGGSSGWTNQFDLTANVQISITSFDLNISSGVGTQGTIDVYLTALGGTYVGNQLNAGAWNLVTSSQTFSSAGAGNPTNAVLNSPITLAAGTYGIALLYNGVSMAYTNGNGGNQTYSNAEVTLNLGASTSGLFSASLFDPRVWNGAVHYQPGANYATATPYGSGCGAGSPSTFYELYSASNTFDLSNTGFTMFATGNGYTVAPVSAPIVTPTGSPIAYRDDETQQIALPFAFPYPGGATNDIWLCSNGWMAFEATTATDLTESASGLISGPPRLCAIWDDLNPATGGTINAEVDPTNSSLFHVTFLGVPEYSAGGSNDFQITLSASGTIEFKYGACSVGDCLVGFSRGGGVRDPGGIDISTAVQNVFLLGDDRPGLTLASVSRPVLGQTATVRTRDIPAGAPAGFVLVGTSALSPGFDLSAIQMTGCFLWLNTVASAGYPIAGPTADFSLAVPSTPALAGQHLYLQCGVIAPGINPFGVAVTNGMDWKLDIN